MYVCTSQSKRSRLEPAADLISDMPEIIISHILSSLPTKDAVRTCVLSRNWKYKWTCITNVAVDDNTLNSLRGTRWRHKVASYISFVNRFIVLSRTSRISTFRLYFHPTNNSLLKLWITALLRRNVQRLDITAIYIKAGLPSTCFSGWTSLIAVKLTLKCTLSVSAVNFFPNLKSLALYGTTITNEHQARHISMNFPLLESLELSVVEWLGVDSVEIQAPSLIRFNTFLNGFGESKHYGIQIQIYAPKLQEFASYYGSIRNIVLIAPAVTHATVRQFPTTEYELALPCCSILKGFPNLKSLDLSGAVIEALTKSRLISSLSTVHRVRELKLLQFIGPDRNILEFIRVMPYLESLHINMKDPVFENNEYFGETPPFIYLKELKCTIWKRKIDELDLLKSILKNSKNLENLLVLASKNRRKIRSWLSKVMTKGSRCVVNVEKA